MLETLLPEVMDEQVIDSNSSLHTDSIAEQVMRPRFRLKSSANLLVVASFECNRHQGRTAPASNARRTEVPKYWMLPFRPGPQPCFSRWPRDQSALQLNIRCKMSTCEAWAVTTRHSCSANPLSAIFIHLGFDSLEICYAGLFLTSRSLILL